MKKVTINGTEYILYAGGENKAVSIYPHMVEASSGKVPLGKQMSLLKAYLKANGLSSPVCCMAVVIIPNQFVWLYRKALIRIVMVQPSVRLLA